uniref:Uncharacterized protein n=1 Tax=Arundo donax TaxID=35708 RepID=A0A0A9EWM1_ARUDO
MELPHVVAEAPSLPGNLNQILLFGTCAKSLIMNARIKVLKLWLAAC